MSNKQWGPGHPIYETRVYLTLVWLLFGMLALIGIIEWVLGTLRPDAHGVVVFFGVIAVTALIWSASISILHRTDDR